MNAFWQVQSSIQSSRSLYSKYVMQWETLSGSAAAAAAAVSLCPFDSTAKK